MFRRILIVCVLLCCVVSSGWAYSPAETPGIRLPGGALGGIFYTDCMWRMSQGSLSPRESADAVRISAARNEYEPFQLVVEPLKALKNVTVTPRTLTGPKGATIPAWNISVRKIEFVKWEEPPAKPPKYWIPQDYTIPDPLPELQPFAAPERQRSAVWVTVYVPDKTPAGDYSGTIDITADGGIKASVVLKLQVWDFTLPTVSKLRTAFGCSYENPIKFHGAKTLEEKRKLVELYNRDFWRHRVSPMKPYEFYDVKVERAGDSLKVDFAEFDKAVARYFPLFNSFALPGFEVGNDFGLNLGDDYERLKIEYMRSVAEHVANKGQIAKAYAICDSSDAGVVAEQADLCSKADERIRVMWPGQSTEPKLAGSVDIWGIWAFLKAPIVPKGSEAWLFIPPHAPDFASYAIDHHKETHRRATWIAWDYGMKGIICNETTDWGSKPYEEAMQLYSDHNGTWGHGKGGLLYPPAKTPSGKFVDKGPVPSIRWELIRESIEDYDYFVILKERIESARKGDASNPAIVQGEEALKMVRKCAGVDSRAQELMAARAKVAQAIEALK